MHLQMLADLCRECQEVLCSVCLWKGCVWSSELFHERNVNFFHIFHTFQVVFCKTDTKCTKSFKWGCQRMVMRFNNTPARRTRKCRMICLLATFRVSLSKLQMMAHWASVMWTGVGFHMVSKCHLLSDRDPWMPEPLVQPGVPCHNFAIIYHIDCLKCCLKPNVDVWESKQRLQVVGG